MKLIDTKRQTNSQQANDNLREALWNINCKTMRLLLDGLAKVIEGYESIENPDEDDLIKLKFAQESQAILKEGYRRTKNLMGVNSES